MSRIAFYGNDTYQTLERFRIHYPEAGEKADEFDAIDADEFEKYLVKELIEWFAGPLKDTKPHRYHHNEYKKQACQAAAIGLNVSCHHLSLVNVLLDRVLHSSHSRADIAETAAEGLYKTAFVWAKYALPLDISLRLEVFVKTDCITKRSSRRS